MKILFLNSELRTGWGIGKCRNPVKSKKSKMVPRNSFSNTFYPQGLAPSSGIWVSSSLRVLAWRKSLTGRQKEANRWSLKFRVCHVSQSDQTGFSSASLPPLSNPFFFFFCDSFIISLKPSFADKINSAWLFLPSSPFLFGSYNFYQHSLVVLYPCTWNEIKLLPSEKSP